MKVNVMVFVLIVLSCSVLFGQETWVKTFGGTKFEYCKSITYTHDGGYVLTGTTSSNDGDFVGTNKGKEDIIILKMNSRGNIQWKISYGGSEDERGLSITTSPDGGFVLTGRTKSNDGDFEEMNKGGDDIFVIRLDSNGNVQWKRLFGGSGSDWGFSITTTHDGGYVLTGRTESNDGDFNKLNNGEDDIFVIKLDSKGSIQWKRLFGGSSIEVGYSITTSPDGGFVLTGRTLSNSGDFNEMNKGKEDIFVIKLDSNGGIQWKRLFGGSQNDWGFSITKTPDGGFILTGKTGPNVGDFIDMNKGKEVIIIVKMDSRGVVQWRKSFGESRNDWGLSITPTPDGGFVLTGRTGPNDGDVKRMNMINEDIIIVKMNSRGDIEWKKSIGGSDSEFGESIVTTRDGGYVLTGRTKSNDGEFNKMNKGGDDIFVIKVDKNGNLQPNSKKSKRK
jgi:hypothetical protein